MGTQIDKRQSATVSGLTGSVHLGITGCGRRQEVTEWVCLTPPACVTFRGILNDMGSNTRKNVSRRVNLCRAFKSFAFGGLFVFLLRCDEQGSFAFSKSDSKLLTSSIISYMASYMADFHVVHIDLANKMC